MGSGLDRNRIRIGSELDNIWIGIGEGSNLDWIRLELEWDQIIFLLFADLYCSFFALLKYSLSFVLFHFVVNTHNSISTTLSVEAHIFLFQPSPFQIPQQIKCWGHNKTSQSCSGGEET